MKTSEHRRIYQSKHRTVLSMAVDEIALAGAAALEAPPNMLPTATAARPLQANTEAAPDAAVLERTNWFKGASR